jgi:hypothetical protein
LKRIFIGIVPLMVGLLSATPPLMAHHGNAQYDDRHPVRLTGIVTGFSWMNPHSLIYFDVKSTHGHLAHWICETHSPGVLKKNGWTETSLRPGDRITVILDRAKNGDPVGWSGAAGRHSIAVRNGPVLTFNKAQD